MKLLFACLSICKILLCAQKHTCPPTFLIFYLPSPAAYVLIPPVVFEVGSQHQFIWTLGAYLAEYQGTVQHLAFCTSSPVSNICTSKSSPQVKAATAATASSNESSGLCNNWTFLWFKYCSYLSLFDTPICLALHVILTCLFLYKTLYVFTSHHITVVEITVSSRVSWCIRIVKEVYSPCVTASFLTWKIKTKREKHGGPHGFGIRCQMSTTTLQFKYSWEPLVHLSLSIVSCHILQYEIHLNTLVIAETLHLLCLLRTTLHACCTCTLQTVLFRDFRILARHVLSILLRDVISLSISNLHPWRRELIIWHCSPPHTSPFFAVVVTLTVFQVV